MHSISLIRLVAIQRAFSCATTALSEGVQAVSNSNKGDSYALTNPEIKPKYKGVVKLPRDGLKTVMIRGTGAFVFVEFEATHLPRIELESL